MTKRRRSQRLKAQSSPRQRQQRRPKVQTATPHKPVHIKREQPLKQFLITDFHRCHLCQYRTNSSYFICQHYERHQLQDPLFDCSRAVAKYKCEKCDLVTNVFVDLKNHKCHNNSTKYITNYKCEKCDFRTHSRLVQLKHALFQCANKYNKRKPRQDYFKSYQFLLQIQHMNVEWLKCERCDYMARLEGTLGSHMLTEHSKESNLSWYQCKLCLLNVEQIFYLRQHILIEHGEDEDELDY